MTKTETTASINDKVNDKNQSCKEHILKTLKVMNRALNYDDFGRLFSYGTYRNEMSKLVKHGEVLVLPKECPTRFILPKWASRPEYACVLRNDRRSTAGKFDFLSYLESLDWNVPLAVHNLKLGFSVYQLGWLGSGWDYCKSSHSCKRIFELSYPVRVQCYDTGSVLVHIRCSTRPFPLDYLGLMALSSLLGEVKNALKAPCIPDSQTWQIEQWHLNRDANISGGGLDVNLTFRDFFGDCAQFYNKKTLMVMRAEVNQSPRRSIQQVFENIINRDAPKGGS